MKKKLSSQTLGVDVFFLDFSDQFLF